MKVNYNVSAMIANNALQRNDNLLTESIKRLSSGLKIANAKDNPSGLAMARRMNAQIEGLGVANDSSGDGISIVQVADGSLSEMHDVLQRMNELAIKASNGTLTSHDREYIQAEIGQLKDEIERMARTTQFNGQNILDGSFDYKGYATVPDGANPGEYITNTDLSVLTYSDLVDGGKYDIKGLNVTVKESTGDTGVVRRTLEVANPQNISITKEGESGSYMKEPLSVSTQEDILTISDINGKEIKLQIKDDYSGDMKLELTGNGAMTMQVGANEGQTLDIRIPKISWQTLGIANVDVTLTQVDGNPVNGALEAIDSIKNAISEISNIRSRLGAYQNRLEHTVSNLDITVENMTAAYSRIMDVDMAEEMTTYSTQQVLSQAGTSMMAQANQRPSQVLQLLQ